MSEPRAAIFEIIERVLSEIGYPYPGDEEVNRIMKYFNGRHEKYKKPPLLGMQFVNHTVAHVFGIDQEELRSKKTRKMDYIKPKHLAMYFMQRYGNETDKIADYYGLKERTSISNAMKSVSNQCVTDRLYFKVFKDIEKKLLNLDMFYNGKQE